MSRAATVSVVIPVYNGERFLTAAVESIRGQTHPAAEVIVVDDGSTDGSLVLAQALAREWSALRVLSQPNGGPSVARNAGVARASGELLTFLDADDEMLPDRLAFQVAYLAEHPGADVVMGTEWIHLEEGVVPPDWLRSHAPGAAHPYIMSLMVRRAAFDRVGTFEPARRLGEEIDWLFRARAAGLGIATVERPLLRRRVHGANLTSDLTLEQVRQNLLEIAHSRVVERRAPGGTGSPG